MIELVGVIEQGFDELARLLGGLIASSYNDPASPDHLDELCALREKAARAAAMLKNLRAGE